MTGNRLIERRAAAEAAGSSNHCPFGYLDPREWCSWANSEKARDDVIWIVGPNGTPILVDDEQVCGARHIAEARARNEEVRRFNWRQNHPVTEGQAA